MLYVSNNLVSARCMLVSSGQPWMRRRRTDSMECDADTPGDLLILFLLAAYYFNFSCFSHSAHYVSCEFLIGIDLPGRKQLKFYPVPHLQTSHNRMPNSYGMSPSTSCTRRRQVKR